MIGEHVIFRSDSEEWATPQAMFDLLNREFGFTIDVCATAENAKCERFFSKAENSLIQKWDGVCFCNPPYGKEIGKWMQKAYESSLGGGNGRMSCICADRYPVVAQIRYASC